ncbi:inositol monophosphatase [Candidatus Parcubacteria bacterium]|nr:MAG: inositol monophosphatase [Candidatus Parcubacteria bacterium]
MNSKIKKIAEQAAMKSGRELKKIYNNFSRATVSFKSHHEILTKADLASEKIIINEIKKNFPEHQILAEESGDNKKQSDYLWIIDPVDGTTNFSMHNPLWAVSIGVAHKGKLVFGLVHAPILGETFVAELGCGARMNGKKIKVSNIKKDRAINTFCHSGEQKDIRQATKYHRHQKLHGFDCRQIGSASIELAYVACGRVESIMIPGAHAWDVAAGVLLVSEAGGRVTNFENKKWNLESRDILASNGLVHKNIINLL